MSDLGFIHRFVPSRSPSSRVLLLLHGTGGNEDDLLSLGRSLAPEAALLSPRGKVLENGHPRFFRRLAEGVFDEEDVMRRANELADFLNAAASQYQFDPQSLTAVGYSNGANIAAAVLLLRPETISSAILLRAMVPLRQIAPPRLTSQRVLISIGQADLIVPAADGERLAELLRSAGAEVTVATQPAGHNLIPQDISAARAWLSAG
jgi:phospholipase/carboxylesterase